MKSKKTNCNLYVEYQRIVDKKSMFRASREDVIYVRFVAHIPGVSHCIIREEVFTDAKKARQTYDMWRQAISN